MHIRWFLGIFSGFLFFSCQKQSNFNGNALLTLSADSVQFDTVFTATGGITQKVLVINHNNFSLGISDISLMGGSNSPFVINIDGSPGPEATNLQLARNDSLYIFVNVFVRPGSAPLPFILQDSIRIRSGGADQFIQLSVWGQNAHFLKNQVISGNVDWPNDLPYVISGGLVIKNNAVLTIQKGTHVYFHANAPLLVDGSLQVFGQPADSARVYFNGDRLDLPYAAYPGSWPGIYFRENSHDNILNYALLENGYNSVVAYGPSQNAAPKLVLNQCIIQNSYAAGIYCVQSSVNASNCLISNCNQNILISLGGVYQFEQCTVASYSYNLLTHQLPVLSISNAATDSTLSIANDLRAVFSNCIFWGSDGVPDEALVSKQGNTVFQVHFDHSILKQENYPANIDSSSLWLNINPLFISTGGGTGSLFDFHLQSGSPALNRGADLGILFDLDGNPRPVHLPDLGCYERQ